MDNAVAHQLRKENKSKSHEAIKNEAKILIASYIDDNHIPTGTDLTECYQAIDSVLEMHFDTAHTYYLARQTPILTTSPEKSGFHTSAFYAIQVIVCRGF